MNIWLRTIYPNTCRWNIHETTFQMHQSQRWHTPYLYICSSWRSLFHFLTIQILMLNVQRYLFCFVLISLYRNVLTVSPHFLYFHVANSCNILLQCLFINMLLEVSSVALILLVTLNYAPWLLIEYFRGTNPLPIVSGTRHAWRFCKHALVFSLDNVEAMFCLGCRGHCIVRPSSWVTNVHTSGISILWQGASSPHCQCSSVNTIQQSHRKKDSLEGDHVIH